MCGWMGGSVGQWVGSGHITKYPINLDVIKIVQFCLKIYDFLRHPYLWVGVWIHGWPHVKSLISNKSWPNRDNSIMDILDIFLDILLTPPQPLMGLFFSMYLVSFTKWLLLITAMNVIKCNGIQILCDISVVIEY